MNRAAPEKTSTKSARVLGIWGSRGIPAIPLILWWARGDSNARPLPCQGSALTN